MPSPTVFIGDFFPCHTIGHTRKKEFTLPGSKLGYGSFSVVRRVRWKKMVNQKVALKVINIRKGMSDLDTHRKIMEVLREINHPNIVKLHDYFQTPRYWYSILELAPGGCLKANESMP
ncbi:kinase-like protein [Atractiella rhizophila]|nr:kinase-like protein [Atractiella rhizophila]